MGEPIIKRVIFPRLLRTTSEISLSLFLSFFFLYTFISDHVVTRRTRDAFFRIWQVHLSETWTSKKWKCQGHCEIGMLVFWSRNFYFFFVITLSRCHDIIQFRYKSKLSNCIFYISFIIYIWFFFIFVIST